MHILKLIVLVCVLDSECSCKSIAEVVAGSGLKCFSVMHQGLDGVGCLCTCEFLFVCLLAFDNRDCKYFLTEVRIQVQHLDGTLFGFLCCCMCGVAFLP